LLISCFFILAGFIFLGLALGAVPITLQKLWLWIWGQSDAHTQLIIESLRLPRTLLAALIGAILAICGAAAQGLFRNSLADPSLIGVSAGAAAGASVVIVLLQYSNWSFFGLTLISVGAFVGAILVVLCVYRLATTTMGTSVATMLLAGIAFSYLAGSFSNALEFVADSQKLRQLSLWRMGGLDSADLQHVKLAALTLLGIAAILIRQNKALNVLLLGESEARHLGIDVAKVKRHTIVCIAAGVGVTVALAGVISFVGLVIPHIVRMLVGPNHRYLLPISALVGAIILVLADILARIIIAPTELPLGLLTALIGAPIFIFLLRSRHPVGIP
jgi:iron complex transport system permease protein